MATKNADAVSMKKGSYIVLDGEPCKVSDVGISRPGKHGHAKVRIVAVGMLDGKKRDVVMPGHESVLVPIVEKRNAQVLSVSGNTASVMDAETYETFDLAIPEELHGALTDGAIVLYWDLMGTKVMKQLKSAGESDDE